MQYIETADRPLCPNQAIGVTSHPAHALHVQLQNAAYNVIPHDEDLQAINPEQEKVYNAISDQRFDGRMNLYRGISTVFGQQSARGITTIEAWFYMCPMCGLIIPANRIESS